MKKIILIVLVICVCAGLSLSLAACGGANLQGSSWEDKETFVYSAMKDGALIGNLRVSSQRIARNGEAVEIEQLGRSFSVQGGTKIETAYTALDGTSMYSVALLDASNKTPAASYRVEKDKDGNVVEESKAVYSTKGSQYICDYTYKKAGEEAQSGTFKQKLLFVDNATVYYLLRTFDLGGLSQTLSVPSFPNGSVVSLSATAAATLTVSDIVLSVTEKSGTENETTETLNSLELIRIGVTLNSTPSGTPNYVDYTTVTEAQTFGRATTPCKKLPYRMQEGEITYTLLSLTL